jgi:beta-N-acetylhexosaminidase
VGGVILFGRNWSDRQQLTKLCRKIKKLRPDALICVMRTDFPGGYLCQVGSDYRTLPYGS